MSLSLTKRELLAQVLDNEGLRQVVSSVYRWRGLLVLNYHRIGDPGNSSWDRDLWSASEQDFSHQVEYLARDFDLVGVSDLEEALRENAARCVMITFDDGYRDNYEAAFPILRAHGVPATFFLTTGFLDRRRIAWWDEIAWMVRKSPRQAIKANSWTTQAVEYDEPDRCLAIRRLLDTYKELPGTQTSAYLDFLAEATGSGRCPPAMAEGLWMTWDMVREMRAAGMHFGAHTVNHPILSSLTGEKQDWEILESRLRIEFELGEPVSTFSYPDGSRTAFDSETRLCLARQGFDWAFSHHGGYCSPDSFDRFNIPRIPIESDVSHAVFRSCTAFPTVFC